MFKNLTIYRVSEFWNYDYDQLEDAMSYSCFAPCSATQEKSMGWVPPRGNMHGAMLESVGGQWIARMMTETKQIPPSVLNRKLAERLASIEEKEGRKPGKKEKQELKDEIKIDLLPHAFTKLAATWVWIDHAKRLLMIDTASQSTADAVVTALVEASPGFAASLLDTALTPQSCMANWLHSHDAPAGFSIDRECELKSADESKAVVKYGRHPLDIDEIREHITQGKLPTKLAMTFNDRVSFVLTDGMHLRKLDILNAAMEDQGQEDGGFDADIAIATGELSELIPALINALGGEGRTELTKV